MQTEPRYLTDRELRTRYSVHRATIWRWIKTRGFPESVKLGGCTRWRLADVEAWEQGQGVAR